MKKFFTLIAAVAMAASVNAQTLINYPTSQDGITLGGTCTATSVKIHVNVDKLDCLKFANGYTTDGVINDNVMTLTVDGGFKAGDVVTIAGAVSVNAEEAETKTGAVAIFTGEKDAAANVLYTTENFVNGKVSADDPKDYTYTLTEDATVLKLGRKGGTGTNITKLTVVRGGATGINSAVAEVESADADAPAYNLAGQKVGANAKGIIIKDGKKYIRK